MLTIQFSRLTKSLTTNVTALQAFHCSHINAGFGKHIKKVKKLKGKDVTSQNWLLRQISDPYVHKAKEDHYRCRSVYKLQEINEKYSILKPGHVIVDCGAAPGSWSQMAAAEVNADIFGKPGTGLVVAVDLLNIQPIPGVHTLGNCDFNSKTTRTKLSQVLNGRAVNLVMSDMSPKATGNREMDHHNIIKLCLSVLRFSRHVLNPGGNMLVKLWQGAEDKKLQTLCDNMFTSTKFIKPPASREHSAEVFLLARNLKERKLLNG